MNKDLLSKSILQTSSFQQLASQLKETPKLHIKESVGSLDAFIIAKLHKQYSTVLVITDTDENERFLRSDIETLSEYECVNFPPTNHKPYNDEQIVDSSLLVQRSEALEAINSD